MPYVEANGLKFRYEDAGSGPTIVWLHGLLNSIERSRLLSEGMDGLATRGYRLVQYDARGHGQADATPDQVDYVWESHADDMLALLDALGIERAAVGGGSMGAGVSLVFAAKYPQRVEKLIAFVPPPLRDTIETAQQVFGGLASLIESLGLEKAVDVVLNLPEYVEMEKSDPARHATMREWLHGIREDTAVPAIRGLLFGPALPEERFSEVKAPALAIAQPDDPIHPASTAEKMHAAIPGSQLIVAPQFEYYRAHHDELLETMATFLAEGPCP